MSLLPKHLLNLSKSDLEGMCVDCGLCCYASAPFGKGMVLVPELRCKHLAFKSDGASCCSIYETRHDTGWCMPLAKAIEQNIFPDACPYVQDMKDYVGSAVLSDEAYEAVRPQLKKSMLNNERPEWVSPSHWEKFASE